MFVRLWQDDGGALLAMEWIFMATILVIGLVVGLTAIRQAISNELEEIAGAIGSLNQSYSFGGQSGCCATVAGSSYTDVARETYSITSCVAPVEQPVVACPD